MWWLYCGILSALKSSSLILDYLQQSQAWWGSPLATVWSHGRPAIRSINCGKRLKPAKRCNEQKRRKKGIYCISQLNLLCTISLLFQWYKVCPKSTGVGRVHQSMHRNGSEYTEDRTSNKLTVVRQSMHRNGNEYTEDRNGNVKQTNSLCLPEGVDDGTLWVPHHVVVPQPCLWVDGLSHRSQNTQWCSFVPAGKYMYIYMHNQKCVCTHTYTCTTHTHNAPPPTPMPVTPQ